MVKDMSVARVRAIVNKISDTLIMQKGPVSPDVLHSAIRRSLQKDFHDLNINVLLKVKGNDRTHKIHSVTIAQDIKHAEDHTNT